MDNHGSPNLGRNFEYEERDQNKQNMPKGNKNNARNKEKLESNLNIILLKKDDIKAPKLKIMVCKRNS